MSAKTMRDFSLEVYMSKWEFVAKYNLTGSDAENMTLGELLSLASEADRAAFDKLSLAYTETWGAPALREAIAGTYDGIDSRDVLCFAGAEEGMVDTERYILIQMPWPAREGSMWHSGHLGDAASYAGLSFSVRRGLGGSGQTASGIVRVERASPTEGVLYIDGATANTADGVHGAVRGSIAFKLCR